MIIHCYSLTPMNHQYVIFTTYNYWLNHRPSHQCLVCMEPVTMLNIAAHLEDHDTDESITFLIGGCFQVSYYLHTLSLNYLM